MAEAVPQRVLDRLQVQERFDCWNRDELEPMLELYDYRPDGKVVRAGLLPDVATALALAE